MILKIKFIQTGQNRLRERADFKQKGKSEDSISKKFLNFYLFTLRSKPARSRRRF